MEICCSFKALVNRLAERIGLSQIFFPLLDKILSVRKGEIIFEFESDKVIYEVEAPEAGILGRKFSFEGEKVSVGTLVAYLAPLEPDPSTY